MADEGRNCPTGIKNWSKENDDAAWLILFEIEYHIYHNGCNKIWYFILHFNVWAVGIHTFLQILIPK